jgi:hypothetical protein
MAPYDVLDSPALGVRPHFADLAAAMAEARQARDAEQAEYDKHAPPADRLAALVAEHRALAATMGDETPELTDYTRDLFRLNRLQQEIGTLEVDLDALKSAQRALDEANAHLAALGERFREAHLLAAVEAARRYLQTTYAPAVAEMIQRRNVVTQLAAALEVIGHAQELPAAVAAAGTIRRMVGQLTIGATAAPSLARLAIAGTPVHGGRARPPELLRLITSVIISRT